MKIFHSHPWNVGLEEAKSIQEKLSKFILTKDCFQEIKVIGGVGINFNSSNLAIAITMFDYPALKKLHSFSGIYPLFFPYTPNFFAFSCGEQILSILQRIQLPDLLIFPGKGIAHPRRLGLASHLGVLLNIPAIACSKRAFIRSYPEPEMTKGSFEYIFEKKEKIGIVLRSRDFVKPIFVTPGNRISVKSSLDIVLHCCINFRLPEPLRQAQISARKELF
ncbi:MAG: endonuclease V [candidate division Zixibacteria bacterium]|nr:endonuclease V [candidate division Zixibacteria bacterium]